MNETSKNAKTVSNEINWLNQYIENRLQNYFDSSKIFQVPIKPDLSNDDSKYADFIKNNRVGG